MTVQTYTRLDLAKNQLETAIGLFISGGDRFSAISLAGAADVILSRLVTNSGAENFTEFSLRLERERGDDPGPREAHGKNLNDTLFINHLKHLDDGDDGYVDMDPEECALASILKALSNYVSLAGKKDPFVLAFLAWVRLNLDPKKYNIYGDPTWRPAVGEA
jgi:hypothetical protein